MLAALKSLGAEPGGDSVPDLLLTYLVHDGRWRRHRLPAACCRAARQLPPAKWYSLALDQAQVDAKIGALESHRTQAAVMDRLFRSLARPNEIFGVIERAQLPSSPASRCGPELPRAAPGTVPIVVSSPSATPGAAPRRRSAPSSGRA